MNLFESIPQNLPEEVIEVLAVSENTRIERIISQGHYSPDDFWYDQAQDEFVLLLQGQAKLQFSDPDKLIVLNRGDFLMIPAHQRHRVSWTATDTKTIWLAVFL